VTADFEKMIAKTTNYTIYMVLANIDTLVNKQISGLLFKKRQLRGV
jgi:hypothetical protein